MEFNIVPSYPAMQEKYPDGVYGVTSILKIWVSLEKIGIKKGYCIEDFMDLIQALILKGNVRTISMYFDAVEMLDDGYYIDRHNTIHTTQSGIWWLDIFSYLNEYELEKQFALVGGKESYLSVCKKHNVSFEFSREFDGCFIKLPFDFQDTPELRSELIATNQELCDCVLKNQQAFHQ